MKILLLFASNKIGGAERSLTRVFCNCSGVDLQFATLSYPGPLTDWLFSIGLNPLSFGNVNWFKIFVKLYHHFKTVHYDIVYVCGVKTSIYIRFLKLFLSSNFKLIHGIRWNPDLNTRLDFILFMTDRFVNSDIDHWITNSFVTRYTLINTFKINPSRITAIYNGITLPIKHAYKNDKDNLIVLTIANFSLRKGYIEYLDVISNISKIMPSVRFVFVGRDDMSGKISDLIKLRNLESFISVHGFHDDVDQFYRSADIFVLPSITNEGAPTSILEAMSYSLPCVAFAIDGIPELIISGKNGYLSPKGDYTSFQSNIIYLLSNFSIRNEFSLYSHHRAISKFSLSKSFQNHLNVFYTLH